MEKSAIVIEKDYTVELEHFDDTITAEDEALARKARYYYDQAKKLPYVVDEKAAAKFNEMVSACDRIAKEFSGRLKAAVSFETHEAEILLECVLIEFERGEFMEVLRELTRTAMRISFLPLPSGFLRIQLRMPYFLAETKERRS